MAINFPSTNGQATDGSYTYTVAGITYSWNGSSWTAAGAGASATDRTLFSVNTNSSGSAALSYTSATGVFDYTPPNLSSYLTSESDPVYSAAPAAGITNANITNWNSAYGWGDHSIGGYLTALGSIGGHSDVTLGTPQLNEILQYDGSAWVNQTNSGGLQLRTTASVTQSIASLGISNTQISTPKSYALMKIQTTHAAWVTLYSDTNSRTSDAGRLETTDPTPGSGVLSEVITTGAQTQMITPATVCFNESGTGTTYVKIVNKSGSTVNLSVTLTYLQLEA
jgi:hypothetical protein